MWLTVFSGLKPFIIKALAIDVASVVECAPFRGDRVRAGEPVVGE
jgi:hypothetical protein